MDLAINTQKAAKRLQLWPRGCGGLGGGGMGRDEGVGSGMVRSSLLSPASWSEGGGRRQ